MGSVSSHIKRLRDRLSSRIRHAPPRHGAVLPDALGADTVVSIDPSARATVDSPDGRVVLHTDLGRLWALNATASMIWDCLAAGRPLGDAAAELTTRFEIPRGQADADVRAFVSMLVARRLAHCSVTNAKDAGR